MSQRNCINILFLNLDFPTDLCLSFFTIIFIIIPWTCRLRDNIEELRRSLQPKEDALEALQLSLQEKEQVFMAMVL